MHVVFFRVTSVHPLLSFFFFAHLEHPIRALRDGVLNESAVQWFYVSRIVSAEIIAIGFDGRQNANNR